MAFFLVILVESSLSAAITGKFAKNGTDYVCRVYSQAYHVDDKVLKIYGKHMKVRGNDTDYAYGNNNVTVFDASNKLNDIQKIPTTVLHLFPNLSVMKLEAINLKVIDENSFERCSNLKKLFFGKDNIEFIGPGVFEPCSNLEEIVFNGSVINSIDDEAFRGLSKLKVLKFIGNNFTQISPELFKGLTELTELTITGNPITTFDPNVFLALTNLRVLNLENNALASVSSDLLRFKEKLEIVSFRNNSIVMIDNRMLENWPNHAELNLLGNICIDRNFGPLGTDLLPMSDVVGYFANCYGALKVLELENGFKGSTDINSEYEENESTLFSELSSESTSGSSEHDEIANESPVTNSTVVVEETDENLSESSESEYQETKMSTTQASPDKENFEDKFGPEQPIYFRENVTSSEEQTTIEEADHDHGVESSEGDEEEEYFEEGDNKESTTPTPSSEGATDDISIPNYSGNVTIVDDDTIAAANISEPIESNSTFNSSNTSIDESNQGSDTSIDGSDQDADTTFNETTIFNESSSETDSAEQSAFLHSYEQADCRFYVSAKNEYTCVLKNVKNTLKRINIKHIDEDFTNDNVTVLFMRDCDLLHIPRVIFDVFPHLKSLSMERCGIKTMDAELFEVCGNLQNLDLSNNKILQVKGDSLKMCPMLGFVDLTSNPVEKIESSIFECNPKLSISLGALKIVSQS